MRATDTNKTAKLSRVLIANFIGGMSWALGMTLGFSILVYILSLILNAVGGLPLIGNYLADIITYTQQALNNRQF